MHGSPQRERCVHVIARRKRVPDARSGRYRVVKSRCARGGNAVTNYPHVPPAANRQCHHLREIASPVIRIDVCTWATRLRHFENNLSPREAITDPNGGFVGAEHSEVFAECTGFAIKVLFVAPPRPVVGRIDAHGLVRASVHGQVGLSVAFDTESAKKSGGGVDGCFPDRREERFSVPRADDAGGAAIDREKLERHRLTFFRDL